MNEEQFYEALKQDGIELTTNQLAQFSTYYRLLVEWNEKMNLTSITQKSEVYLKHFYDSISAAFYTDFSDQHICDVGAGAGFPSIPLKICFPDLKITIVDSLNKRITFLNELAEALKLENVAFVHDRAEIFGQNKEYRESFDVVTARAVARMSVLSELCLPLCKESGVFIAMKGSKASDELTDAQIAIKALGGKLEREETFELPGEEGLRSIIFIKKERKTPKKYPRKAGTPNKSPIGGV